MTDRVCSIGGCDRPWSCRDWCNTHYQRWKRHGDPLILKVLANRSVSDRLDQYTHRTDSCWLWTGAKSTDGYGMLWVDGKARLVHRVSYEMHVGQVPDGLALDHLCRVRLCVNPSHLEPVTNRTNVLRGAGLPAINVRKTHCKRGHPFDEANTYIYRSERYCRACDAARKRARKQQTEEIPP